MRKITDPVEKIVERALIKNDVNYEAPFQGPDFILKDSGVHIECKALFTDRVIKQMRGRKIIVIQTREAARAFADLIGAGEMMEPNYSHRNYWLNIVLLLLALPVTLNAINQLCGGCVVNVVEALK